MITKAGKQMMSVWSLFPKVNNAQTAVPKFPNDPIKNVTNQQRWIAVASGDCFSNGFTPITANNTNPGVHFGTGTNTPTENDYYLQTPITSGLGAAITLTEMKINSQGKPYVRTVFSVTNGSSSASLTITEICVVTGSAYCCTSSTATSYSANNVMFDRTLLDDPLVLAPLQTGTLEYIITCDMSFT